MLSDTTGIRHLARRWRERAAEIRAEADRLRRRVDEVRWQGRAAEAMRAAVTARIAALAGTAALHDAAADALDRHARAVDLTGGVVGAALHEIRDLL